MKSRLILKTIILFLFLGCETPSVFQGTYEKRCTLVYKVCEDCPIHQTQVFIRTSYDQRGSQKYSIFNMGHREIDMSLLTVVQIKKPYEIIERDSNKLNTSFSNTKLQLERYSLIGN